MTTPFAAALAAADPEEVETNETIYGASQVDDPGIPNPQPVTDNLAPVDDPNNPKG